MVYQIFEIKFISYRYLTICKLHLLIVFQQQNILNSNLNSDFDSQTYYLYLEDKNFITYKNSLVKELSTKLACNALMPDDLLYEDAKCYGNEISKNKRRPHERINCLTRNYGECIYFGSGEAKHIALQWLIDSGVESLAHRRMCLLPAYRKAGIKVNTHFEYAYCSVLELGK